MPLALSAVTLVVRDYDEAIAWYRDKLGFAVLEDTPLGRGKRWVTIAPDHTGMRLLLATAQGPAQIARIGDQTGGRVFLFLETDDFNRDHAAFKAAGVQFLEAPRRESYGIVAVFADLFGNKWDLIQRERSGMGA
jgi:catechol 2,3-dioxygenase-like lactoylglutathione lyase family enzyme